MHGAKKHKLIKQSALKLCSSLDDIFNVIPKRSTTCSSTPVITADTLSFPRKLRAMFPSFVVYGPSSGISRRESPSGSETCA